MRSVIGRRSFPLEIEEEIIQKTDGVPLFVEELTKMVVRSELLKESVGGFRLSGAVVASLAIPSTLQDSLRARFDQLGAAKEAAQVGAAIGREFPRTLLVALEVCGGHLDSALEELIRSELVYRRGSETNEVYTFRHALIRDTAYQSMLKTQRALWHGQIAGAIEHYMPETASAQSPQTG